MLNSKTLFNKVALNSLYLTRLHKLFAPFTRGEGIIFTLHQVGHQPTEPFSPNNILKITPAFLESTIKKVKELNYDIISLDEVPERLGAPQKSPPFAVFTFDDGYKDNRDIALKIFEKYNIPLTIYVVSDYSSHQGELWWLALEEIIKSNSEVKDPFIKKRHNTATTAQKYRTYEELYWQLRYRNQPQQREVINQFANDHNFNISQLTRDLIMSWEELRALNEHPLVTLGAHTKSHFAVGLLEKEAAIEEINTGVEKMQDELGERPKHFSYPYGDARSAGQRDFEIVKELGFSTAVTTAKAMLYKDHKDHLTALPRVSLNGSYQHRRYLETFLTGVPFVLANRRRAINIT